MSHVARNAIILACAVDAADKALLPATFAALAEQFQLGPKDLGALIFAQSIAFSVALPLWGSMLHFFSPRDLLLFGCLLWGILTLLLAAVSSFALQFLLRLCVGGALAVVNPIGQALICDLTPEGERGWAFGLLQSVSTALAMSVTFATTSTARTTIFGFQGWRVAHVAVANMSFAACVAVAMLVPTKCNSSAPRNVGKSWAAEQYRVVKLVASKPSFIIMVSQGVTGGIPWNAISFVTFFLQLSGYTDGEAGQVILLGGFGGVLGGLLGGKLGDSFNKIWPYSGRCMVAQASVVLGTLSFLWFVYIPFRPGNFMIVAIAYFVFQSTACWTPSAALRPICGEIVRNSQDRAQILALWIALEGIIASIMGAPLAGILSEKFGYRLEKGSGLPAVNDRFASLLALRKALVGVSVVPWILCFLAWFPMYWTYRRDARDVLVKHDALLASVKGNDEVAFEEVSNNGSKGN